jgi:hypothetical protein
MKNVDVQILVRYEELVFPYLPESPINAGMVQDVQIGKSSESSWQVLGGVALDDGHEIFDVSLPADAAQRMAYQYDLRYRLGQGERTDDGPVIDCHNFVAYVKGDALVQDLTLSAAFETTDQGQSVDPDCLEEGRAYGMHTYLATEPINANAHSVLALKGGRNSLSVMGTNGPLVVTDNNDILDLFGGLRFSPVDVVPVESD